MPKNFAPCLFNLNSQPSEYVPKLEHGKQSGFAAFGRQIINALERCTLHYAWTGCLDDALRVMQLVQWMESCPQIL